MEKAAAPPRTLAALEYPSVLSLLEERCRSPYGREAARSLVPTPEAGEARRRQDSSREMILHIQKSGSFPLAVPVDLRPALSRLELAGATLAGADILLFLEQMKVMQSVRDQLFRAEGGGLRHLGRELPDLSNLVRFLDGKINPRGELEDRCSADLVRIRRQIASVSLRLEEALREISSRGEVARALQDDFVSLRNNRHVLPIRIDAQGCLEGIVHALSSSGATVFVEPLATVPLNNELVRLREEEEVEVRRLLEEFCDLLRSRKPELETGVAVLAEVDLLSAQAALAEAMGGVEPEWSDGAAGTGAVELALEAARHPILEASLRAAQGTLIPLDLELEAGRQVLVISGPNTGGKTVALKTVGLLALMAQSGLKVPARSARLPVFRSVLIDIGDRQSISDSLSTFSARMANISEMVTELATPALVLLDEVGTGTDPEEGASLGAAIIEFFRNRRALVLATTHHQSLKAYAAATPAVANASMEFDETSLRPLYRLRTGVPGRSGGLDIAQRLGLPAEIVALARSFLPRQRELLEEYLRSLELLQEEAHRRAAALDRREREGREREAEREQASLRLARDRESRFAEFLESAGAALEQRGEALLREIADREAERRVRRELERRERELIASARASLDPDFVPPAPEPGGPANPIPGERVRLSGLGVEGTVERVDGDRVIVRAGAKILNLRRGDLAAPARPAGGNRLPKGVQLTRSAEATLPSEIVLIGKTVDEALPLIDKYLDDAALAALSPVRIVHGMGTGRLRAAIWKFLDGHPHVEGFGEAEEKEGGRGATLVRLRT